MSEPIIITSRNNARLAHVRKVRDGKVEDEIFVEGSRVVTEVIRSKAKVIECLITNELAETDFGKRLKWRLDRDKRQVIQLPETLFKTIADTVQSQGIALLVRRPDTGPGLLENSLAPERAARLFVCLHESNDPSNVGAVFRAAEAAGVGGVVLSKGSADAFSPKAMRAGMGSNVRVPVWDRADMNEVIEWARRQKLQILATDVEAELSYTKIDWRKPSLIIFGSEAHGLEKGILEAADAAITIPMKNGVESLNLAVSAGIILFEAVRQAA